MKNNNSQKNRKLRNDIILAVAIIFIAAAGLLLFVLNREEGSTVSVKIDGKQTASYPLSEKLPTPKGVGSDFWNYFLKLLTAFTMMSVHCSMPRTPVSRQRS